MTGIAIWAFAGMFIGFAIDAARAKRRTCADQHCRRRFTTIAERELHETNAHQLAPRHITRRTP